jgi:hypothetical protein
MPVRFSRMTRVARVAVLTLSAAACQSGGDAGRTEPANLVADVAAGGQGVSLRWESVPGTSYEVFRAAKAAGASEQSVGVVDVSTYQDSGEDLAADTDYVYRVSARASDQHESVSSATVRVHTPADPSCAIVCARIAACLGGHGGEYGDYGSGYGDYGGGYGDYGSYGGGYGDYGSYGGGDGDYGSYGEYGGGDGDYGSYGDGGYGSYGSYGGGYGSSGTKAACSSSCQALPAQARRKIVVCIGSRSSCHETLACE